MMKLLGAVALGVGIAGAGPALAQSKDQVLVIYGSDRCPANTICVKAPESDRYRIPKNLRDGSLPAGDQTWASRASSTSRAGAASGIGSCSPVGAGGATGCTQQMLRQAREERRAARAASEASSTPNYAAQSQVTSENPQ